MTQHPVHEDNRNRRGETFVNSSARFPLEQEACLELPLGYTPEITMPSRVGVFLHAFHLNLLPEVRAYLDHVPIPSDLFISTDTRDKHDAIVAAFKDWPTGRVIVSVMPNRGRDIASKLYGFGDAHDDYEFVLHLHTKQSPHDDRLAGWRGYLYETLLGSPDIVRSIFAGFAACRSLGILAPQHVDELRPWIRWGVNHKPAEALAMRLGFRLPLEAPLDFPSGSMFWARTAALRPLLDLGLGFYDFPEETGQTDGTLAHAIERLYYLVCEEAGFSWMKITAKGELHDQRGSIAITSSDELARVLRQSALNLTARRGVRRLGREQPVITSALPKPRRILHVLWRRALGGIADVPERWLTVVVLRDDAAGDPALLQTVQRELAALPGNGKGDVVVEATITRSEALARSFERGADFVLMLDQPCMLMPGSIDALCRMAVAHGSCALIEATSVPDLHPKAVDTNSLEVEWVGGPVFAMTRAAYERVGSFDDRLAGQAAQQDLSWRARSLEVPLLKSPRALFYPLGGKPGAARPASGIDQLSTPLPVAPGTLDSGKVDVVVRLYDTTDLPRLRLCLFSLLGQKRGASKAALSERLQVYVMTQRFTAEQVRQTRETVDPLLVGDDEVSVTIFNWDYRDPFDVRVPLLNWALEVSDGRFMIVVECTDLLISRSLARLRARLADTGAAAAIGGVHRQQVLWWGDIVVPLTIEGSQTAEASAPFALLDRSRIGKALTFEVGSSGMESAAYLDSLRPSAVDEALRAVPLCVRQSTG